MDAGGTGPVGTLEHRPYRGEPAEQRLPFAEVFRRTTWADRNLSATCLAGLATNFKDGMLWGLLPLFLTARGLGLVQAGTVAALSPALWAVGQPVFGPLSDRLGRKALIVGGMALQGLGVWAFVLVESYPGYLAASAAAGLGTAMVYPVLLALASDVALPAWRASALGVFRFWRDMGYVLGALGTGLIADAAGFSAAMLAAVLLTLLAARIVATRVRLLARA